MLSANPFLVTTPWTRLGVVFALLALAACGSTDSEPEPDPPAAEEGPIFAVSTRIPGSVVSGFVGLVDSLDGGRTLDLAEAIEIPNGGIAVGPELGGTIFLVDGATPQLEKIEVLADGTLERRGILSTQNLSLTSSGVAAGNVVFLSETKAFIIDTLAFLIIVWNPDTLEITGTIDFRDAQVPGTISVAGNTSVQRDDELVFAVSLIADSTFEPDSALVFVDLETDTVNRVVEIPDCSAVSDVLLAGDGSLYAASDVASVFNRLSGRNDDTTECLVRIPPGTYDLEDYTLFSERTEGSLAGTMLQLSDTRAYARVLDQSLLPGTIIDIPDVNGASAWSWGIVDVSGETPFQPITGLGTTAGSTNPFVIEGAFWATESTDNLESTNLINLGSETPTRGLSSPGIILNAFRVR
ncbi:MAG: hypothetical protein AAGF92_16995 [Myxococcota bacterium]